MEDESTNGHDFSEDEIMHLELNHLFQSGGRDPPMWASMPEFAGMSRATRAYA